ncbi:hypothetical protein OROGR_029537 [Orobanche gracilis]
MERASALVLCLYLLIVHSPICMCENPEGVALFAFKDKLSDPNGMLNGWNSDNDLCLWPHITCDSSNLVYSIDLGNSGLSGPLVSNLGVLTNLQKLHLFENKIYGTIPEELGNLKKLVSLWVKLL